MRGWETAVAPLWLDLPLTDVFYQNPVKIW